MKIRLSLVLFVLMLFAAAWAVAAATGHAAPPGTQEVARAVIARERAAFDAWQRKDKSFFAGYMADDATYFGMMSPYLETDPKENFLPNFEKIAETFKPLDFQMYNPRVQVYGDTAVLTYNAAQTVNFGGRVMHYTSKMTSVYVRQQGVWRVVHGHESMNPGAQ